MKVIICGAGSVGEILTNFLDTENYDITVVDKDPQLTNQLSKKFDIKVVNGNSAHPSVLEKAGANEADILIAATNEDEVNMIACSIAHHMFNIPKNISRVSGKEYLNEQWSDLFTEKRIPIDCLFSPEGYLANSVYERLEFPGAIDVRNFANGKVKLLGFNCGEDCPILNTNLSDLSEIFPGLNAIIVTIFRDGKYITPENDKQILVGDNVYIIVEDRHIDRVSSAFGKDFYKYKNVAILGGGKTAMLLAEKLDVLHKDWNVKIIEKDFVKSGIIVDKLNDVQVISGDVLEKSIIDEIGFDDIDISVAITDDVEINLVYSILAKNSGTKTALSLITSRDHDNIFKNINIDMLVDKSTVISSSILPQIRRGRINDSYLIRIGHGEVIEAKVTSSCDFVGKKINEIKFPESVVIGAIVRDGKFVYPKGNSEIMSGDVVVMYVGSESVKWVEDIFSVSLEVF